MDAAAVRGKRGGGQGQGHDTEQRGHVNNGEYAIKFLHSIGKSNVNKNRLLFPIPQTEMDANTLMVQNPGY